MRNKKQIFILTFLISFVNTYSFFDSKEVSKKIITELGEFFIEKPVTLINSTFNRPEHIEILQDVLEYCEGVGIALVGLFASIKLLKKVTANNSFSWTYLIEPVVFIGIGHYTVLNSTKILGYVESIGRGIISNLTKELEVTSIIASTKSVIDANDNALFHILYVIIFLIVCVVILVAFAFIVVSLLFRAIQLIGLKAISPIWFAGFASTETISFATGFIIKYLQIVLQLYFILVGLYVLSRLNKTLGFDDLEGMGMLLVPLIFSLTGAYMALKVKSILFKG